MLSKKNKEDIALDKIMKKYGARLCQLRTIKKLTIDQAAKNIDITPAKLAKIEKGTFDFTIEILFKLGVLYDFEPREFVNLYTKKANTKNRNK